jgi:hypothetical protein
MASDIQNNLSFAHETNIKKYQKILQTHLTTEERRFVERRLNEEQAALEDLTGTSSQ